jgi:transcriptional antiterminator
MNAERPDVLLIHELAAELRISVRTIQKRRRAKCFPIPELQRMDRRPRWGREAVEAYKRSTQNQPSWRAKR